MNRLWIIVVVASLGAAMAQTLKVGINLELSGPFAAMGTATLQGIEAAFAQLPDADIELSICDNATTVEGSVACANRFADEGVTAVLGAGASSMAIPAAEVLQDAGIIMISTSSANPATTQIGDYIYRMAYTDDFQGKVAARYAFNDLSSSSAIVFRQQDDDYSFGLAGFFVDEFTALGGETVVVDFVANTVDFTSQIDDIIGLPADVIYYSGFCAEGVHLMTQLQDSGFEQQILGADAADDSQCPLEGGNAFDGMLFTGVGGPDALGGEAGQRASDFETFFRVVFPEAADFNGFTLAGADSLNVLIEAFRRAGSSDVGTINAALGALEGFPGVSGEITYAGTDGTPSDRTIAFFKYQVPADNDQGWAKILQFGIGTGK